MKTKDPAAISAAVAEVRERLAERRTALGYAVVADRETKALHREVAELEQRERELAAALPVAEAAVREAAAAAERARLAEIAREDAARAKARVAAAKRVDGILRDLGKAHALLVDLPLPSGASPQTVARADAALRGAILHLAPTVAASTGMERAPHAMRRPMAEVLQ